MHCMTCSASSWLIILIKQASYANPRADKNKLDQVHIFQYTCFQSLQIHLQVIMYRFEHTNRGNHRDFLI